MAATEFLNALNKLKKNQGKLDGFNAPAPMESIVDTIGQVPESNQLLEDPSIQDPQDSFSLENPEVMAGLGLGGGFVASQTGGAPATSRVLSPFAQKVAARDASRIATQNLAIPKQKINIPRTIAGSALTMAMIPNQMGDATLDSAYKNAVSQGEDPAAAAARLGVEDTSILGLDKSNREVATVNGRGVLNGVNLFTGDAASTGSNYADLVNTDREQREDFAAGNVYPPVQQPQNVAAIKTVAQEPSVDAATLEAFNPVGGGFSYGGDTPIPADRENNFLKNPRLKEFFTGGTPVFANQGQEPILTPEAAPVVEVATPEDITEAGQVAPAIEVDPYAAGSSMVSRSNGKTLIDGVEATPEQIDAYNKAAPARNKARRAAEEKAYKEAAPEREKARKAKEAEQAAAKLEASRPKRETPAERRQKENRLKKELRRTGQEEIKQKMSEFSRTGASSGERARYKAFLKSQLDVNIDKELQYSRKEYEDTFTSDINAFNKANLSAAQISAQEQAAASLRANQDKMGTVEEKMKMLDALNINDPEKRKNYAIQILGIDPDLYIEGTNENVVVKPTILGDTTPSKGDTREQLGKNYKFDGKKWNEVK